MRISFKDTPKMNLPSRQIFSNIDIKTKRERFLELKAENKQLKKRLQLLELFLDDLNNGDTFGTDTWQGLFNDFVHYLGS